MQGPEFLYVYNKANLGEGHKEFKEKTNGKGGKVRKRLIVVFFLSESLLSPPNYTFCLP